MSSVCNFFNLLIDDLHMSTDTSIFEEHFGNLRINRTDFLSSFQIIRVFITLQYTYSILYLLYRIWRPYKRPGPVIMAFKARAAHSYLF